MSAIVVLSLSACQTGEEPKTCNEGFGLVGDECYPLAGEIVDCEDGYGLVGDECEELVSNLPKCEEGFGLVEDTCQILQGVINIPEGMDPVFFEVMSELLKSHYTNPVEVDLWEGAIEGMIDSLDDPYTTYFDLEEYQQYRVGFGETYVGIGVAVRYTNGTIVVEEVKSNSPALESGMQVNDIIVSVDGEMIMEENFYEVINKILGDEGTLVTVGVIRQGINEVIEIPMIRAVIDNPTVEYETFTKDGVKVGYIKVNSFGGATDELFGAAISTLEALEIEGLIVDLRNNGGGQLGTVYNMLREFLISDGNRMFGTEAKYDGLLEEYNYFGFGFTEKDYDIVTLVNEGSASASEVFASAMQEHSGYPVIGSQTFGKGTMQLTSLLYSAEVWEDDEEVCQAEFGEDSEVPCRLGTDRLHVTIGKWLTADGNWLHGIGVTPDVVVERSDIERAYKVFLQEEEILYDTVDVRLENIQLILNTMGYEVRTDGYFDDVTKAAIMDIQTTNSLTVTGNIDSDTLVFINDALSTYLNDVENDTQLQASIDYFVSE